jgi:hypothetical protein
MNNDIEIKVVIKVKNNKKKRWWIYLVGNVQGRLSMYIYIVYSVVQHG